MFLCQGSGDTEALFQKGIVGMSQRVDFHCHILPNADHGSDSIQVSLNQLLLQRKAGIKRIVATPHFYPEQTSIEDFLCLREDCAGALLAAMPKETPPIHLGAEVLVCPGMEEMEGLERLCIAGTKTILLEMPFGHFSERVLYTVEQLTLRDILPVMAHIDRYESEDVRALMSLPVLAQVNAASLCKRGIRKMLEKYFMEGRVVALATDLHGCKKNALADYEKGLLKLGAYNEAEINDATSKILRNAKILGE